VKFKNIKKKVERVYSDRKDYNRLEKKFYKIRRNGFADEEIK
jgi:hypothetical protein